jgi:hypothetical protein
MGDSKEVKANSVVTDTRWLLAAALGVALLGLGCTAIKLGLRDPGETNKSMPDAVASEYHCEKRQLPFFELESVELLPERVKRGKEINHRIVYVMCPEHPTEVVKGRLDTRILHRGKAIFSEMIEHELKPGRWIVDTFIPLPELAEPGVYALQLEFHSAYGEINSQSDFVVTDH